MNLADAFCRLVLATETITHGADKPRGAISIGEHVILCFDFRVHMTASPDYEQIFLFQLDW